MKVPAIMEMFRFIQYHNIVYIYTCIHVFYVWCYIYLSRRFVKNVAAKNVIFSAAIKKKMKSHRTYNLGNYNCINNQNKNFRNSIVISSRLKT